jgi:site-specific recombinase XerD
MTAPPTHKDKTFPYEEITNDEAHALLTVRSNDTPTAMRNRAIIAAMLGAGLRNSEVTALSPGNVNLERGSIHVLHGKGDKARIAGCLAPQLLHVARWRDARKVLGIRGPVLMCGLWRGARGHALGDRQIRQIVADTAARAGIEHRVHPHALRHWHACELERNGVVMTNIQEQLGHTHLNTTAVYLRKMSPSARINQIVNLYGEG